MKSSLRVGLGLIAVSSLFAFVACGDDDDSPTPAAHAGSGGEGATAHGGDGQGGHGHSGEGHGGAATLALECKVIGTLCHEADTGSGTAHDCHEVGHEGRADACAEQFDACITFCTAEDEGNGGAGGKPAETKDPHCAALGELCHVVDDETGPLHECHELGHIGNAAKCAAGFDDCAALCLAAREALPPHTEGGAGGAGGAAHSHGGAAHGGAGGAGGAQ
jgi:hypothetical protein